ncbi:MAG: hypothetical protein QN195_01645 [Armatimonadota bacterium]|nr:hypothetical protein [Armatimonadota bacterium]MDR7450050.1 hypothetical protein [Armatimonadota bacterium]MDR7458975.1 hypothetical protein [Armatimonadota bacterium]MDR7478880.1 hypothetical protein [Armatimonadota bacterium]MDR7488278.1 hypothetical protein [Armatimonadota bacterium]
MRWALLPIIALLLRSLLPSPAPAAPGARATVELLGVAHGLADRQFTVTGTVRNAGPLAVSRLVIDVWGYGPQGDLAAFGSDGIPWILAPGESEAFRAVLPLGRTLIRSYRLAVTDARPPLVDPPVLTRTVEAGLYTALALREVRVVTEVRPGTVTLRALPGDLPVARVRARLTVLVHDGATLVIHTMPVPLVVGEVLRVGFAGPVVRVLAVEVTGVDFEAAWSGWLPRTPPDA